MFTRAHNKHTSRDQGPSRESGLCAPIPASSQDITVDEALLALDRGLCGLAQLPVAQATKERGWALLSRELARHPVRASAPALIKGTGAKGPLGANPARPVVAGPSRTWRVALGSTAAAVAIVAALLGSYAAGLLGGPDSGPGPVASATTSATAPETTTPTDATTVVTPAPDTTQTTPPTGAGTSTTATEATTPPSGGSPGTNPPVTTAPAQTTTTNEEQWAAAQRIKTAKDAAKALGDAVLYYFATGEMSGMRSLVASSAQASLTQMIASLGDGDGPNGFNLVASKSLGATTVRITLEFIAAADERPRFNLTVRVSDQGATITAIAAGS